MNVTLHVLNKLKYLAEENGLEFSIYPDKDNKGHSIIAVGEHRFTLNYFNEESMEDAYLLIAANLQFERYKHQDLDKLLNG